MTRLFTTNYSRPIVGAVSLTISFLTLLLVSQKLELQKVQSERDVAVTRASEFKQAFEKERQKRALLFMLNEAASAGKKNGTGHSDLSKEGASRFTRQPEMIIDAPPIAMMQSVVPLPHLAH